MKRIPTQTDFSSNTTRRVAFEDRLLSITFLWDEPAGSFFMNIEDGIGGELKGIRVVEDIPLLQNKKAFIDFAGDIRVIREDSDAAEELDYGNFGDGWNPYLITEDEATAWREANGF